jgi:hypothetical protein
VLEDEDASAFAALLADLEARFRPAGGLEREQVRAMAGALWRLRRGGGVEAVTLQALIDKAEDGALGVDEVISVPQLLLRIGRYEGQLQRSYERARDRLRELQEARAAQPTAAQPAGLPDQARQRQERPICHDRAQTRSSMPGERAAAPKSVLPSRALSQFCAGNGFVSSRIDGPPSWSAAARLRTGCAWAALLGPPPAASWRFASALRGATLALAQEALPRAA